VDVPIKPPALAPGDTVGVVAVAAAVEPTHLKRGAAALADCGYRVKLSPYACESAGILACDDHLRARELTAFFRDPEVKAIFAARGGYGSGRLLPLLNFAELARSPKIFVGFSDVTFLLNALFQLGHMVTFHGPMVATDFAHGLSERARSHLQELLSGGQKLEWQAVEVLRPGIAEGRLIGGCLSVITAMIGTPWQPVFDGRILFLEDTGEKAYRIDRMLVQMRQVGLLDRVAGVVFGSLRPVDTSEHERALIAEFVREQTSHLKCPVLLGIESGHGTENLTLPLGINVRLDADLRRLTLQEVAVTR
jgi:muramoyltetrapeptide carboxypeptidase